MNSLPHFTLRIRTEQQDIDWLVQPGEITFHQALEVISQILPDSNTSAFQYDDSDGERITVRSDDELRAMFEMFYCELSETDIVQGLIEPIIIYPRLGKTPKDRNIHDLKIKTSKNSQPGLKRLNQLPKQESSIVSRAPNVPQNLLPMQQTHSTQTGTRTGSAAARSIKEILTCGNIMAQDLQQIDVIGKGNGGQVYKAFHRPTQRQMAVKQIELDVDVEVQKKILLELEILYRCHSPAIICFYGAFFIENRISICTEFMDGGSLDRYGQIPEEILGRMSFRLVQGLIYMWEQKILHRDIKPSNILVNTLGDVKLCDFGVSTQLVQSIAMTYVGTNAYMSPERIKAEHYGVPSEIWSLGITLYELATGQFPFKELKTEVNPAQLCHSITEGAPPVLPESHFTREFVHLVASCLQKIPEQRISKTELLAHPFIQKYVIDDESVRIMSAWIRTHLPNIKKFGLL